MEDINQEEWKNRTAKNKNAVIIDVRTPDEFAEGYIPNALNIDIYDAPNFMSEINKLDKSKEYYVYCKSGGRSAQACSIMEQIGFENTNNLKGGFSEWNGEATTGNN